jgi:hypothetical protein
MKINYFELDCEKELFLDMLMLIRWIDSIHIEELIDKLEPDL